MPDVNAVYGKMTEYEWNAMKAPYIYRQIVNYDTTAKFPNIESFTLDGSRLGRHILRVQFVINQTLTGLTAGATATEFALLLRNLGNATPLAGGASISSITSGITHTYGGGALAIPAAWVPMAIMVFLHSAQAFVHTNLPAGEYKIVYAQGSVNYSDLRVVLDHTF